MQTQLSALIKTLAIACFTILAVSRPVAAQSTSASVVRALLSTPDVELNYETSKLALDRIVEPDLDQAAVTAQIDRLVAEAKRVAIGSDDIAKLKAVRKVIYEPGAWNNNRPFTYDHADPFGKELQNKLIVTYLDTRRGNCVSMPILQLIVAEKLGLNVSLSTAPLHVFMRYTNPNNRRSIAIESTSGGHPAAEKAYFDKMGVTQRHVNSGIYLGVLTKRESIAVMASTVTEWLMSKGRYQDAIELTDVLLEYYPKDVSAVLWRGTAYGELLRNEFLERFPTPAAIPADLQPRYQMLSSRNAAAFQQAEAWGWTSS